MPGYWTSLDADWEVRREVDHDGGGAALVLADARLERPGRRAGERAWAFEPRLDGWRVLVSVDDDLTVRTRNGLTVTASVPELAPMVAVLEGRSVVLDGELVARQGRPFDFYGLAPRPSAHARASVRVAGRGCR